jgi:hypothetical protein
MPDEFAPSGIAGLDEILRSGLPRHQVYIIQGDPGPGKTTLLLEARPRLPEAAVTRIRVIPHLPPGRRDPRLDHLPSWGGLQSRGYWFSG